MPAAKTATKRKPLTLERAKAFIKSHAPPKHHKRPGTSMTSGAKGLFGIPPIGNTTITTAAAWGIGGAIFLASMFVFPAWLSSLGVALYLYGWWRGNAQMKSTGALLIVVNFVNALGIVETATNKLAEIKREGFFKALSSGDSTGGAGEVPLTPEQIAAARQRAAAKR
jgi:hypothetical protein